MGRKQKLHGSTAKVSSADAENGRRGSTVPSTWRSLDELAGTAEFWRGLAREFPEQADSWGNATSRREFLRLMGASLSLAGAVGCTRIPDEEIVPYVRQPEQIVAGKPLYYATAMELHGSAIGLLVESHEGRPTKVEGNPLHPGTPGNRSDADRTVQSGATNAVAQASLLTLYDPDRSQTLMRHGKIATWDSFLTEINSQMRRQKERQGAGLRILTETIVSPTTFDQLRQLLRLYPQASWHQYDPCHQDHVRSGMRLAFGKDLDAIYHLDRADVVLSLDADFLVTGPGHLRYAADFAERRKTISPDAAAEMSRLYVVESTPTLTGARADHRLSVTPDEITAFAFQLSRQLNVELPSTWMKAHESTDNASSSELAKWAREVAADLEHDRPAGTSLVLAGPTQPPVVQALVHAINERLGNVGRTIEYIEPVAARPVIESESIQELADAMRAKQVEVLIILGGNPVFTAPADLEFSHALEQVSFRVHLSLEEDETSERCHWHIPAQHFLESWSDTRAYDGTVSIIQPLIAPLYNNVSHHDLLAVLLGQPGQKAYQIVRQHWKPQIDESVASFDDWWQKALHEGVLPGTELPRVRASIQWASDAIEDRTTADETADSSLVLVFRADPTIDDGRFANNAWLQELPKPLTKLTWDNAALISPQTARQLALENEDLVEIKIDDRTATFPVWIFPGQPDRVVTVHFGYGRTQAGTVGSGTGFNSYPLRTRDSPWSAIGASLRRLDAKHRLATTQNHWLMEGRDLVRFGTLAEWKTNPKHPNFVESTHEASDVSFYPTYEYEGYKWGMAIDLNACTGCNACVVACQAENNVPVVGKDQVRRGRAMHWLRIDRYYEGELASPSILHQPVACVHCELAPCEVVCPVHATVHGDEGLNQMIYNRCVGTRYCSNNCPYKVRRFNFLQYSDTDTPVLKLLRNPDVTVRNRGVMEKCTYCVQRINAGRITAEKEGRSIRDGEVVTACQASCPSNAIEFGDLNNPSSRVNERKDQPLNYDLLGELNTRPRTSYSAAIRNPNPRLL